MLQFYKIVSNIITFERINDFIYETKNNTAYLEHIQNWRNLNKIKKLQEMENEGWISTPGDRDRTARQILQIPVRHLATFKPYIELFTDFLQKKHSDDLVMSHQLSHLSDMS